MTDVPNFSDDDYVVRVKAQVMTRDDSTGGWTPIRGGLSIVGLRKQKVQQEPEGRLEYLIQGQRITDQTEVLNCILTKDAHYTTANPTFVHWKMEGKRFGLTFTSSHDAKAFDKGIKRAFEDLLEICPDANENICLRAAEDDVFMPLDLPLRRKGSSSMSASTSSTTTSPPSPQSPALPNINDAFQNMQNGNGAIFQHPHANYHHLHKVHYIPRPERTHSKQTSPRSSDKYCSTKSKSDSDFWIKAEIVKQQQDDMVELDIPIDLGIDSSYVQFSSSSHVHDYSYPNIDIKSKTSLSTQSPASSQRRDSISSIKRQNRENFSLNQPQLPLKNKKKRELFKKKEKQQSRQLLRTRAQCKYCKEMFTRDENPKGGCEDAPDSAKNCIECISCLCSARTVLFHCMADEEHNYDHPCICDNADEKNCKKWTVLTILSFLIPCLWCYLPLMACHKCGVACNCCGGRHKAL